MEAAAHLRALLWPGPLGLVREAALALDHWIYSLPLIVTLLGMGGVVARGFGLQYLFRDDDQLFNPDRAWRAPGDEAEAPKRRPLLASPAFWTGFGFMAAFGLFWIVAHTSGRLDCGTRLRPAPCPTELYQEHPIPEAGAIRMGVALALALVALVLANWIQLRRPRADDFQRSGLWSRIREVARLTAGALLGVAATLLGYLIPLGLAPLATGGPAVLRHFAAISFAVPAAVFVLQVALRPNALPCTSIFSLLTALLLIGALFPNGWAHWASLAVLGAVIVVALRNGWPGKYSLPGFKPAVPGIPFNPQGSPEGTSFAELIKPTEALIGWRNKQESAKPVLVVVATSGGAYRAAFWTSLLLDHLIEHDGRWHGLHRNIRLFTGASGGMVASAYFAAMAAEGKLDQGITRRISQDTRESLRRKEHRKHPIARDSLSPVVHQLVRGDVPHTLSRWSQTEDRGRKLDDQWLTLHRTFRSFWQAEKEGAVPSIILAPMLVETGALALFSNLDLGQIRKRNVPEPYRPGDENKTSVEVFRAFECAHHTVSLATAVRLNASFPYVSPAISLPVWPQRRPVDAGYYDNFGIDLLTAYLDDPDISAWIVANCAGVAVLQIRAFPSEVPTPPARWLARALQFVISPPEALFNARKASQMFRNDQALVATSKRYNQGRATGQEFLKVFTFEANTDVSMSWYQRCDEMRAMQGLLSPPTLRDLRELYKRDLHPPDEKIDTRTIRLAAVQWAADTWDASMWQLKETDERFKSGWDKFMLALQEDDPIALRSQYLHHRAKVAAELEALAQFWSRRASPARVGQGL
jgi:hypothetical protein